MAVYEFEGLRPIIGEGSYIHPQAVLIGAVNIGRGCLICAGAVLRADFGRISIGDGSNIQDNGVCHVRPGGSVAVEQDVIVGHAAILHDAVVRRGAVIGMGSILQNDTVVEEEAMVGAGAVLAPRFVVPARKIVVGNPARIHKDVSDEMLQMARAGLKLYQQLPERYLQGARLVEDPPRNLS